MSALRRLGSKILAILLLVLILGCTSPQVKKPVPVNETNRSQHYLKHIFFEDLPDNRTKITLVYEFPATNYNASIVSIGVKNGTATIFVDVKRTGEGLQVITKRNLTVIVNETVNTAVVLTAQPD